MSKLEKVYYPGVGQGDEARPDGEDALIDLREVEARAERLGFPTPERTLRLYVAEGVLPPPVLRNGRPVYEERWVLDALQAIALMRGFGRPLAEIRAVIRSLEEAPQVLLDKLRFLDEHYVDEDGDGRDELRPEDVQTLVDRFFGALAGAAGQRRQPSEVSLLDLVYDLGRGSPASQDDSEADADHDDPIADEGPELSAELRAQAEAAGATIATAPAEARPGAPDPEAEPGAAAARSEALRRGRPVRDDGPISVERARALEELFLTRFDESMARLCRIPHPGDEALYPAGPRDRIHLKRTRSDEVIDLMKRHRVYDRELLDALPLDEVSEYRIFTRSIFGRKDVRVVLAACVVSPLESLIARREADALSGPLELDRAIQAVSPRDGAFYYLGVLSTTGWEPGIERYLPSAPNILACLVENRGGSEWQLRRRDDDRWSGLHRLFDPETEREKIDRAKRRLLEHPELALRGGHVILRSLREALRVPEHVLMAAVAEVVRNDSDLSLQEVGGRVILKRRRI